MRLHVTHLRGSLVLTLVMTALASCASESSSSGGSDTSTAADGTDGADAQDGTDGTDGADPCGVPAGAACSPFCAETMGCGDGQLCTLNGGAYQCLDAGPQTVGKPCNNEALCGEGACISTDKDGNRCLGFCRKDEDCPETEACNVTVKLESGDEVGFCGARPKACSMFLQDCTEAGQGCYLGDPDPVCIKAGDKETGAACTASNDCSPGRLCIDDKCLEVCNPRTNGADPKCDFKCPGRQANLTGYTDIAVCTIKDETPPCDLLAQDCDAGKACYQTIDGPRCRDAGSTPAGGECGSDEDCEPKTACVATRCKPLCDPQAAMHPECTDSLTNCPALGNTGAGYCDQ
ncbi:MAG: hypothetical protein IV100_20135 [Myxococcales bacterium]|nr:hypothetical protein [Myxococcales bacterium]